MILTKTGSDRISFSANRIGSDSKKTLSDHVQYIEQLPLFIKTSRYSIKLKH